MMAQNVCNVPSGTKTEPSVEEFQRKLHRWFEEQGLLSDLRAHMRQLIIAALKGTQLAPQAGNSTHQNTSPKIQAINLLVAEFLLLQECHYTLSVFTSEVPLLRNLPEFSPSFKDAAKNKLTAKKSGEVHASPSRLQERRVWDILEALGFSPDSSAGKAVFKSYEESNGEPLLTCLIRSVSKVIRCEKKNEKPLVQTQENISVSDNDSVLLNTENSDTENDKNEKKISAIRTILQKLNVKPKYMKRLENEIKRLIKATKLAEQEQFHEKLLSYEKRIQEERAHYEKDLYSQIVLAQQQLVGQAATSETGLRSLETQVMAALEKLQRNLRLVEERDKRKEQEEQEHKKKIPKKTELTLSKEKKDILDNRQQEIKHRAKSKKCAEKLATVPRVQHLESQHDTGQILEEKSSCFTEGDTNEEHGQMTMTSSISQQESSVSNRDRGVQAGKPSWQVINDFEEIRATVQQLQQENEELRNLMQQQQVQVSELRTWGQLHLAPSVSRSLGQTQLVDHPDCTPAVPSPSPPPLPPRVPQQRVLYPPGDDELHFRATGATCMAPASTQKRASGRSRPRRLRHLSTPRRYIPSSEETSPTEEMLRDARRRLRQLEEESEAVDRSYREFCLRQQKATPVSDVLAGLLQPPARTDECPLNNVPNTSDATGDPSGLKLLTPFPPRTGDFSSESLVGAVGRTEAEVTRITLETQNTSVPHNTSPTVKQDSNLCLSDIFYNIPSSDVDSQNSVSIHDLNTSNAVVEAHTNSYQTGKTEAQSEVHTTHFYKTPMLNSIIGNTSTKADKLNNSVTMENFDSCYGYNKHKNKALNSGKIDSTNDGMIVPEENSVCSQRYHTLVAETVDNSDPSAMKKVQNKTALNSHQAKKTAETVHSNAKGPESLNLVTPLDNSLKILKDSKATEQQPERQGIGSAVENFLEKLYEQKPLKTIVLTDLTKETHTNQTSDAKSEGNRKFMYQTTSENDDAQVMELQASPDRSFKSVDHSFKSKELSNPRISDMLLLPESSEELQEEKVVTLQEKDSKSNNILHKITDIVSERLSLGDAEFIPASSGDQLFAPTCDTDTETEPEPSRSDMLPVNHHQNRPNYGTEEQAISNASISSEQPISAGKSVSSHDKDFW